MQLQEWYKCPTCPEFHPVELDVCFKMILKGTLPSQAQEEMRSGDNFYYLYAELYGMLEAKTFQDVHYWSQEVEQSIAFLRSVNSKHLGNPNLIRCQQNLEADYALVKSVKANSRICSSMLKSIFEEVTPVVNWRYYAVQLFSSDATEQWMEVKPFQLHIKPVWFATNRVYQLPTEIVVSKTGDSSNNLVTYMYMCKIMDDGKFKTILTFKYNYTANMYNRVSCVDQVKPLVLSIQADSKNNTNAFTGT